MAHHGVILVENFIDNPEPGYAHIRISKDRKSLIALFDDGEEVEFAGSGGGGGGGVSSADKLTVTNSGFANQQQVNDSLLYVGLQINFSANLPTQLIGTVVKDVTLSWNYNKAVVSQIVNGQNLNVALRQLVLLNQNVSTNKDYGLTANDGKNTSNAGAGIRFENIRIWGVGDAGLTNLANIINGGNDLNGGRGHSFTVNAGANKKIYYARPARFGAGTYSVGGFTGGFTERTVSYTNTKGYTENYIIGESTNTGLGNTTVNVN